MCFYIENELQDKLNKLNAYCIKWNLNINVKKKQVKAMSRLRNRSTKCKYENWSGKYKLGYIPVLTNVLVF